MPPPTVQTSHSQVQTQSHGRVHPHIFNPPTGSRTDSTPHPRHCRSNPCPRPFVHSSTDPLWASRVVGRGWCWRPGRPPLGDGLTTLPQGLVHRLRHAFVARIGFRQSTSRPYSYSVPPFLLITLLWFRVFRCFDFGPPGARTPFFRYQLYFHIFFLGPDKSILKVFFHLEDDFLSWVVTKTNQGFSLFLILFEGV